jgi:adenosylmethionine-8-amino-7-oxononanoate aminotransferase
VAIKMAWQAQRQLGQAHRHRLVAFEGAYHGDTLGCMRMGDRSAYSAPFDELLGPVDRLPWDDADAAEAFFAAHGHEVALCLVEPMLQGAGGMRIGRPEHLRRLAEAVQGAGALLIVDEVAAGFGRTGRLWASEHAGIVPDVMCLSKGITGGTLPLGATACTRRVYEAFLGDDRRTSFLHGHSYAGNPIACAAALASLDVLRDEGTVDRYRRMEAVWREAMPALAAMPGVSGLRCLGGVLAFDLVGGQGGYHDPIGRRVQRAAVAEGLYVRPMGDVVYLMPPACVTDDELRWACGVLGHAVRTALEA